MSCFDLAVREVTTEAIWLGFRRMRALAESVMHKVERVMRKQGKLAVPEVKTRAATAALVLGQSAARARWAWRQSTPGKAGAEVFPQRRLVLRRYRYASERVPGSFCGCDCPRTRRSGYGRSPSAVRGAESAAKTPAPRSHTASSHCGDSTSGTLHDGSHTTRCDRIRTIV